VLAQADERDQSCKDGLGTEQNNLVSCHTQGALKLSYKEESRKLL